MNFTKLAAAGEIGCELEIVDAAALCACLENAPVAIGGIREFLTFLNRHAARLFAIDIFASFGREN